MDPGWRGLGSRARSCQNWRVLEPLDTPPPRALAERIGLESTLRHILDSQCLESGQWTGRLSASEAQVSEQFGIEHVQVLSDSIGREESRALRILGAQDERAVRARQ